MNVPKKVVLCFLFLLAGGPLWAADRPFLMGKTPISISTSVFPVWSFENMDDQDLVSIHGDDFLGIPWDQFADGGPLPASWVRQWSAIAEAAIQSGKIRYLALSPLDSRKTLAQKVDAAGAKQTGWVPVDADGCYPFSTDPNAEKYKRAYIRQANYLIDLLRPRFFSPAIELDIQFYSCPAQKSAYLQWYGDVHRALKAAHPNLVIFPTFQFEYLYGVALSSGAPYTPWCGGPRTDATLRACFQQHLNEALSVPGDRIAFSMYPLQFLYPPIPPDSYTVGFPLAEAFSMVRQSTDRKIWVAETGWPAVKILTSYQHAAPPSACGAILVDTSAVGGESNMGDYLTALLAQAQEKDFEAVVWWENRDLLNDADADLCPCPAGTDAFVILENFYTLGGVAAELSLRRFGNMGLRRFDGSPRAAHAIWKVALARPLATPGSLDRIKAFPNPLRPGGGVMTLTGLPADARLKLYSLNGRPVRTLFADFTGQAAWDGTDAGGGPVDSGVYYLHAEGAGDHRTIKIVVQR
ncbi:MAG TPA: hypothetical protein PLT11_04350 [Elusimicrobiota bacterium]|nr:hypothetical protein [Elusimicrobiota bacterium]